MTGATSADGEDDEGDFGCLGSRFKEQGRDEINLGVLAFLFGFMTFRKRR